MQFKCVFCFVWELLVLLSICLLRNLLAGSDKESPALANRNMAGPSVYFLLNKNAGSKQTGKQVFPLEGNL